MERYFGRMGSKRSHGDLGHSRFQRREFYLSACDKRILTAGVKNLAANPFRTIDETETGPEWLMPFHRRNLTEVFPG